MNSPHISHTAKGAFLMTAGIILFLYVTKIITASLEMIILLASILMIIYGFIEIGGYNKLMQLFNKK
jgi:hypothetical protein